MSERHAALGEAFTDLSLLSGADRAARHGQDLVVPTNSPLSAANEDVHPAMAMYKYAVLQGLELETAAQSASHAGPVRCPGMAPARRSCRISVA